MPDNNQPTILVKKSDGTFARMTLDEIKKAKSGTTAPHPNPLLGKEREEKPHGDAHKTHEHHEHRQSTNHQHPAHGTQQHHSPHPHHAAHGQHQHVSHSSTALGVNPVPLLKKAEEEKPAKEFAAPLEEAPKVAGVSTVISQPRLDEADKVIKRLSFNISPNFLNRLRSLIQLYLKDVRSAEQTKEVAKRPLNEGGLALKPEQAEEIIKMGDEWKKTEKTGEVKLIKTVNNPPPAPSFKPAPVVQSAAPVIKPATVISAPAPVKPTTTPNVRPPQPIKSGDSSSGPLGMTKNQPVATKPKPAVVEPFKIENTSESVDSQLSSRAQTGREISTSIGSEDSLFDPAHNKSGESLGMTVEKPMPINLTHSVKVNMAEEKNNMAAREVQEGKNPGTVEDFLGEKIHTAPVEKKASPLVRDVISEAEEMGPVDEIKKFSLTDFRRLSSNPDEAAARLKQKFINLKDESYLLFLEALKAWRRSPLFVESLKAVEKALATRQKLSIILLDKNKIQWPEIKALLAMEKELVF